MRCKRILGRARFRPTAAASAASPGRRQRFEHQTCKMPTVPEYRSIPLTEASKALASENGGLSTRCIAAKCYAIAVWVTLRPSDFERNR
jgi:hypothetical protein